MADGFMDFFSKEAGQARTKARDEFIDGILSAARRAADYYLGPTGIPDRASSAGRVAAEMNPVVGIMDAMQASGEGRYGDAALETAMALAPAYGVAKAARPVSEAVQEVLLGGSAAAGDAGRAFVERMNQRGPMPTVYSNPVVRADDTISISDAIEAKYPDVNVDLYGNPERGYELSRIVVPEGKRGSGVGSKVMEDMISMADSQGAKISLTPDTSFGGTSVSRLKDFYKKFGFVENKGANKDFSTRNTMYRNPQKPSLPEPQNEAEALAKQVLEMRAAGNAGDVTDEMMAQADPQYMLYNTPLPMDEASRMERAREMGFDTEAALYHGTPSADIEAFRASKSGAAGPGVYTSQRPSTASTYAQGMGLLNRRNTFSDDTGTWTEGGNVLDLLGPRNLQSSEDWTANMMAQMSDGDVPRPQAAAVATQQAIEEGFQGAQARSPISSMGRNVVVFDPRDIRSRFARFDPEFRHLSNLSAGVGGLGILGALASDDERAQLEAYLNGEM